MNYENLLLNRALNERSISFLLERGVSEPWFSNNEDRRVWSFIRNHYTNYNEVPSTEVIKDNFPTYVFVEVSDSLDFLVDEVVKAQRKAIVNNSIRKAIEEIEKFGNHENAVSILQSGFSTLDDNGFHAVSDIDITQNTDQRWEEYLERKNLPGGLRGMATGFSTIDQATSGLQPGQLIVIVAPPKTGKSTLALQMAHNIHSGGKVPVFQSFEMSNQEQITRYDAMRARISHHRLTTGTLTSEEEARYQAKLRGMTMLQHKFWLTDSAGASVISGISNKVQQLQPNVLFIDGVYLMMDEQSGEANTALALTNITRSLKRLAQKHQIPIVITTQALGWKMRKGNVTVDSIGYSSSFFQDADVVFGLQREDENVDDTRLLKVMASRNCGPLEVSLVWDWNTGEFREISSDDM